MTHEPLMAERLKELFYYDEWTGRFTRLVAVSSNAQVGGNAGSPDKYGYIIIKVDGQKYRASNLAWLYKTSAFPEHTVDHRDPSDRTDDRWVNLRQATRSQQMHNTRLRRDNATGFKGVYLRRKPSGRTCWGVAVVVKLHGAFARGTTDDL
jgi:HNH endonuclease